MVMSTVKKMEASAPTDLEFQAMNEERIAAMVRGIRTGW